MELDRGRFLISTRESSPAMAIPKARSPIEWSEDGYDPNGVRKFTIVTTVARVTSDLQRTLQFSLDASRLLLSHLDRGTEQEPTPFHETFLHFDPARNRKLSPADLRVEARRWILRNGFRDAVEAVNSVLENARDLLAI